MKIEVPPGLTVAALEKEFGAALSKRIHGRTPWTFCEAQQACAVLGMSLAEFSGFSPLEG